MTDQSWLVFSPVLYHCHFLALFFFFWFINQFFSFSLCLSCPSISHKPQHTLYNVKNTILWRKFSSCFLSTATHCETPCSCFNKWSFNGMQTVAAITSWMLSLRDNKQLRRNLYIYYSGDKQIRRCDSHSTVISNKVISLFYHRV